MRLLYYVINLPYSIMSVSTTRIAELPENITTHVQPIVSSQPTMQQQIPNHMQGNVSMSHQYAQQQEGNIGANHYVPINIHPNPYGAPSLGPDQMPMPQASPQRNAQQQPPPRQYSNEFANMPIQELPSRDIPTTTMNYTQDPQIQPNYIPNPKLTSDYIREYEAASEKALQKHETHKHREEIAQDWFSSMQLPIFVGILYFIFQMPIVNTLLRKYLSFMTIYHDDGNFNFVGLLLKSSMFASFFYSSQMISQKVSEL